MQNPLYTQILSLIPQKKPFCFVDAILKLDQDHAVGSYEFKDNEPFYIPISKNKAIVPGAILLEAMAQVGISCLWISFLLNEVELTEISQYQPYFTEANIEFNSPVYSKEKILIIAKIIYWRKNKISSTVKIQNSRGLIVATGTVSGVGKKI